MQPLGISMYTIRHENFLEKAQNSITAKQVNSENYTAIYFGGGYGHLFDVATDNNILKIVKEVYEAGGIIGGCGHGAAGFANTKLSNGVFLVNNKKVAGFPNSTELTKSWAKQGTLLPFLVESKLIENGAIAINKNHVKDKHAVISDQRIISSMFLPSATLVAKAMIDQLENQ